MTCTQHEGVWRAGRKAQGQAESPARRLGPHRAAHPGQVDQRPGQERGAVHRPRGELQEGADRTVPILGLPCPYERPPPSHCNVLILAVSSHVPFVARYSSRMLALWGSWSGENVLPGGCFAFAIRVLEPDDVPVVHTLPASCSSLQPRGHAYIAQEADSCLTSLNLLFAQGQCMWLSERTRLPHASVPIGCTPCINSTWL